LYWKSIGYPALFFSLLGINTDKSVSPQPQRADNFGSLKKVNMDQNQHVLSRGQLRPGPQCWKYWIVAFLFCFISCSRYYYAPNSNNIPLLSEKEAKINAQYAIGSLSNGLEIQSAFAITPHFGAMINTMVASGTQKNRSYSSGLSSTTNKTSTKFIEIGGGYFTPVKSTSLLFETYAGIGTGGVKNYYSGKGSSKVNFLKVFVQPTIGVKLKGFEFGVSSRLSWINQNVVSISGAQSNGFYNDLDNISKYPKSFLWEPSLVLRLGGRNFMVQIQQTVSKNLTNPDQQWLQESGYFTIGFTIPVKYQTVAQ
jgi:hypothetical protein